MQTLRPSGEFSEGGAPHPGDFLGHCLVGECDFNAELLLPSSTYFGIPKSASYLYGTWRDADGSLLRALRGITSASSKFAFLFEARADGQLEVVPDARAGMFKGGIRISRLDGGVTFTADRTPAPFIFAHRDHSCSWFDGDSLEVEGTQVAPAIQWFDSWPEGGGCFSATAKYRSSGTFLGRKVQGFVGHEIHYMPEGASWMTAPYGRGREICWQQVANEYDDGSIEQATFAVGSDGWGFALVHDETGAFLGTTNVTAEADVLENGYPSRVTYRFDGQEWVWRLDPQGQRAHTIAGAPLGADGTCTRATETRRVVLSMGNSDWWTDGRAAPLITSGPVALT